MRYECKLKAKDAEKKFSGNDEASLIVEKIDKAILDIAKECEKHGS